MGTNHATRSGASCLLAFTALLGACQNYPFMYRPRQRVAVTTVREVVVGDANTDILFIIDNSGSMGEEQENLKRNTRLFVEELSQSENAYRVGIVTTDARDRDDSNNLRGLDGGRLRLQRATQAELTAAGCGIGPDTSTKPYLERPDPSDPNVTAKRCRLVQDFVASVASIGLGGGTEAGLAAARMALDTTATDVHAHNGDFFRPEADLALVFLTDEDDCSMAESSYELAMTNTWCYEKLSNTIPVADYVSFFAGLKGSSGVRKVRAALIAGGTFTGESAADFTPMGCRLATATGQPTSQCGCWASSVNKYFCSYLTPFGNLDDTPDPPAPATGVNGVADCEALPGSRYHDFLERLREQRVAVSFPGGTYEDSICRAEYDVTLLEIAHKVVLTHCFNVAEDALDPDSVRLSIRHTDTNGTVVDREIPRFDAGDPEADCQSCNGCPQGAWRYVDPRTFCLECGLKKGTGDEYVLTVVNDIVGVDGGPQ